MKLKDCFENMISGEWGEECLVGEQGTKILRTTNFTNTGKISYRDVVERKISDTKIDKKRLKYGDIILEKSGGTDKTPVGRVVFCDEDIEEDTYLCNNFTVGLRTKKDYFAKYLFYLMFFYHLQGKTLSLQNKTTGIRNLKVDSYLNCEINISAKPEQKRIADELDKVSGLIEKRQKQLEKLDLLIKSRFVEMFGDIGSGYAVWASKEGNELFKFSSGKFLEESLRKGQGVPVYGGNGIAWHTDRYLVNKPTIVIGRVGVYCGNVRLINEPAWITDNAIYIKEFRLNLFNLTFLVIYMSLIGFSKYADFSGQPKITQKPLEKQKYIVPPIELQNRFADFVENVERNKSKIKNSLDKLITLKKALMQKYFG